MSRKFLDDHISFKQYRPFLPSAVSIAGAAAGVQSTTYDPGHQFQDFGDGTIFVNEGSRSGAIFGHKYVNRYDLLEQFLQAPALAADMDPATFGAQATIRAYTLANKNFTLSGTNAADSISTLDAGGGVLLTTTTTSADQGIIGAAAAINSVTASSWAKGALSQARPIFEAVIKTGAAVTLQTIWAGLKLTGTSVVATDADQVFFRYQDVATLAAGAGQFQCIATQSTGAITTTVNSGVAVVLGSTYHLKITVDATLIPRFYINGNLVATLPALKTAITLLPFVGVQTGTTAAKTLAVRAVRLSKDLL